MTQFRNAYHCPCGRSWEMFWPHDCDDRCPDCNTSCSPTSSIELDESDAAQWRGAAETIERIKAAHSPTDTIYFNEGGIRRPTTVQKPSRFEMSFEMENLAFDEAPATEIGRILRWIAGQVEAGDLPDWRDNSKSIFDINGNSIGTWKITGGRHAR